MTQKGKGLNSNASSMFLHHVGINILVVTELIKRVTRFERATFTLAR